MPNSDQICNNFETFFCVENFQQNELHIVGACSRKGVLTANSLSSLAN